MSKQDLIYQCIVDHFIDTDQLGDHDPESLSLTLYNIPNDPDTIGEIKRYMSSITSKHQVIALPPYDDRINVKILDIGI
jgi:hypothetical protein